MKILSITFLIISRETTGCYSNSLEKTIKETNELVKTIKLLIVASLLSKLTPNRYTKHHTVPQKEVTKTLHNNSLLTDLKKENGALPFLSLNVTSLWQVSRATFFLLARAVCRRPVVFKDWSRFDGGGAIKIWVDRCAGYLVRI